MNRIMKKLLNYIYYVHYLHLQIAFTHLYNQYFSESGIMQCLQTSTSKFKKKNIYKDNGKVCMAGVFEILL